MARLHGGASSFVSRARVSVSHWYGDMMRELQARDPAPAGVVRVGRWVPVAWLLTSLTLLLARLVH